jgi:ubiquinone/menaquinone biosynthesis C-methylase UbiE/DNA-binding HxlR family transcriptional regulator
MLQMDAMSSILKSLRLLADPTRIRILSLLRREELSVAELQEILAMAQSRISTQLSQLKQAGLVEDRRAGKKSIYAFCEPASDAERQLLATVELAAEQMDEVEADRASLALVLHKRQDKSRAYFDQLAGKFGRSYCPGRSWKGLAETLLKLMPPQVIADLGAGEGTFSQLLAQRAERVIAVDNSEKMIEFASGVARDNGFENLEFRLGNIEEPPIDDASVDLAFFSQALHHAEKPERAIHSAFRILRPGGRVVILDLLKHSVEEARELYADVWMGFSEAEISEFLDSAGFENAEFTVVDREKKSPYFQTLMAIAEKGG